MSGEHESSDWSHVEDAIQRRQADEDEETALARLRDESQFKSSMQEVDGIIGQLKAKSIQRKAALQALEQITTKQLEVLGHQLSEAARAKKGEAHVAVEQFLAELDERYQSVLHEIGVRNEAKRNETLKKLGDITARDLRDIEERDWPQFMKEETLRAITKRWQAFLEKLVKDVED